MSNTESLPLPEASGVPGGDADAVVGEGDKAPSPASVVEENQDGGNDRKRENSPETERGDIKRLCTTLETQLPSVLEKLQEGYKLTGEALKSVNDNIALERQIQRDLSELARTHGSEQVSQKYFLSVMQENLKKAENVEWQIAGPRADQHVSLKTVLSKSLEKLSNLHVGQQAMVAMIKEGNAAIMKGDTAVTGAITAGFAELSHALSGMKDPPVGSSAPAMPPVGTPYGMPGYAASSTPSAAPSAFPPAPSMPAVAPLTPTPPSTSNMGALRISARDETGRDVIVPASPTKNPPGSRLRQEYVNEFGLGFIQYQGGFHHRLPAHFLPPAATL